MVDSVLRISLSSRNRTTVGLKVGSFRVTAITIPCRNRTTVGLKVAGKGKLDALGKVAIAPQWD